MNGPLVSLIVPVYKVEPYLRRCLDSIVGQTYKNLEIILVDDGSPDGCPAICDEYAAKDPRVVVIHKENGGLSDARNAGLEIAKGEYISFVDSDDWVADVYIEALWTALESQKAELAVCNYHVTESSYTLKISDCDYKPSEVLDPIQAVKKLWSKDRVAFVTAWGKLVKASLFNGVRFPKGFLYEDEYTVHKLLYSARQTVFLNVPLYCYFRRPDGIMGEAERSRNRILHAELCRYEFFKEHEVSEIAEQCLAGLCRPLLFEYAQSRKGALDQGFLNSEDVLEKFRRCQKDHWKSCAPLYEKIAMRFFAAIPVLYVLYHEFSRKLHGC